MMVPTKGRYALRVMSDLAENQGEGVPPLRQKLDGLIAGYLDSVTIADLL